MTKHNVVVTDPPWLTRDQLTMSKTPRGAGANYDTLKTQDIINLKVKELAADDSILALWVLSAMLPEGLEAMKSYGYAYKQNWIWVKTKLEPLQPLEKLVRKIIKKEDPKEYVKLIKDEFSKFNMDDALNFFMGHCFRQTHEIALIGTRGKYTKILQNRAQRSVHISPYLRKHSAKPEELQNRLDIMVSGPKLELFARRDRPGYVCVGNECPSTLGEDIRDSIDRLIKLP